MKETYQQRESSKINQEFRSQIRRKDIDRRFNQRRKQLMTLEKDQEAGQLIIKTLDKIKQRLNNIYREQRNNNNQLTKDHLKQLAKISCSVEGCQIIIQYPKELFQNIINQFILNQKYDDSQQQSYALLILNNCMYIHGSYSSYLPSALTISSLSISDRFIQRIFNRALFAIKDDVREFCMSIVFDLVSINDENFVRNLVTSPQYSIIGFLFNQMHTEPPITIALETLRIFLIIMKKLKLEKHQQYRRMRKFLYISIRNSNSPEFTMVAVICIQHFLACMPNEHIMLSQINILPVIYEQALNLGLEKMALHTLRIAETLMLNKKYKQAHELVQFIDRCLSKFTNNDVVVMCYRLIYDILMKKLLEVDEFAFGYEKLIERMLEYYDYASTDLNIIIEVSCCLSIIGSKGKKISKSLIENVALRIKKVLQNLALPQNIYSFLNQSLQMIGIFSNMEE